MTTILPIHRTTTTNPFTISTHNPNTPQPNPLYQIHTSDRKPQLTITRPSSQTQTPTGTISLSSLSSKITLTVHSTSLKMKRPDFLSSGHRFTHPVLGQLEWKEEDLFRKRFKLVNREKSVLARFDKWTPPSSPSTPLSPGGRGRIGGLPGPGSMVRSILAQRKKSYAFLVYVDADEDLLDWIVVTGLGIVEYRMRSDKEWEEELEGAGEDVLF